MRNPDTDEQENRLAPEARGCLFSVLWTAAVATIGVYLLTSTHRWDPVQLQFCAVWLLVWLVGLLPMLLLGRRGGSNVR